MNAVPEVEFFKPEILSSPFEFYATAHGNYPMIKVAGEDVYCVFSDRLVREVIDRTDDFSSDFSHFTVGARAHDPEIKAIADAGWPFVKRWWWPIRPFTLAFANWSMPLSANRGSMRGKPRPILIH